MPSTDDVEELVARVAAGDGRAFAALYDRTAPFVYGLLLRMLRNRDEAEDVAQEVYLQLWRTAATFDSRRSTAVAWIAMVARSRAIDRLRSETSRRAAVEGASVEPSPASADPEEDASISERRGLVRDAMAELPAEQRTALELAFFQGLSHREISERTDIPLGTVKTRIRAAVAKLEKALSALRPERSI